MSSSSTIRISLSEVEKEPAGAIKWKALFDNTNPLTTKVLLRSTHTEELLPWYGFGCQKDFIFTSIPLTSAQDEVVRGIEDQVSQVLKRQDWGNSFKVMPTEKIFPRYGGCAYFEKKADGCLHRVEPDIEKGDLHNTLEKTLVAAALLQVSGVFFDYARHTAKLTFKLVSLVYQWTDVVKSREDIYTSYMGMYGKLAKMGADIVEEAVKAAGLDTQLSSESTDKESFLASLAKIRTANGVRKKLNKMRRDKASAVDAGFLEWAEQQAVKHSCALKAKAEKDEEKRRAQMIQMMRPIQLSTQTLPPQQQQQQSGAAENPMDVELFDSDDEASDCLC